MRGTGAVAVGCDGGGVEGKESVGTRGLRSRA
jgi:hypothetical protein